MCLNPQEQGSRPINLTKSYLSQAEPAGLPIRNGQYSQWGLGVSVNREERESQAHMHTHPTHTGRVSEREGDRSQNREGSLINSSSQKLKTQRKYSEILTVASLGCEIT